METIISDEDGQTDLGRKTPLDIKKLNLRTEGSMKDLHSHVIVQDHPIFGGKGIFATDIIYKGEIVWMDTTPSHEIKEYEIDDVNQWDKEKKEWFLSFAYQVGDTTFRGPDNQIETLDLYTNHSCDPSTWWDNEFTMSARRDILPGDEITFDYSTSETIETAIHVCGCGAKDCRKIISKEDYLRPELQEKYKGHWMPYLQRKIDGLEI